MLSLSGIAVLSFHAITKSQVTGCLKLGYYVQNKVQVHCRHPFTVVQNAIGCQHTNVPNSMEEADYLFSYSLYATQHVPRL